MDRYALTTKAAFLIEKTTTLTIYKYTFEKDPHFDVGRATLRPIRQPRNHQSLAMLSVFFFVWGHPPEFHIHIQHLVACSYIRYLPKTTSEWAWVGARAFFAAIHSWNNRLTIDTYLNVHWVGRRPPNFGYMVYEWDFLFGAECYSLEWDICIGQTLLGFGGEEKWSKQKKKKSISIRAWAPKFRDEEWVGHVGGGMLQNVLTDSCSIIEILWLSIIAAERWQCWSCCKQDVRKFLTICSYLCRQSKLGKTLLPCLTAYQCITM